MGLPEGLITNRAAKLPTDWRKQPKTQRPSGRSQLEEGFMRLWLSLFPDLPVPKRDFRFHKTRKWALDFAFCESKLAVEIEGGVWSRGRHTRGKGYIADCEKYREAVKLGWRVLRYTGEDLKQRPVQCVEEVAKILITIIEG